LDKQLCVLGWGLSLPEKIDKAIKTLQLFEHLSPDGYKLAFSGGKDSIVIKRLADMAGVKYQAIYNVTTIDPPELIQYMREHYPDVQWKRANKPFFRYVEHEGLPTRIARWCCRIYKHMANGETDVQLLGIRAAESAARAQRWKVFTPAMSGGKAVCPILYWTDADVWNFIHAQNLPYCRLYDEGFKRLGCIGCPFGMERQRRIQFERWPGYLKQYQRAARKYWESRPPEKRSSTFERYWELWITDKTEKSDCDLGLW